MGDIIGRIVGWQEVYQRHESHYDPDKGEGPDALRTCWGVVVECDDENEPVPVCHFKGINDGTEGIIFPFMIHTVMPEMYHV